MGGRTTGTNLYNFSPILFDIFGVLVVVDTMPKVVYQFLMKVDYRINREILTE